MFEGDYLLINYDKREIKDSLTLDNIFDVLNTFGGNPEYTNFGVLASTICHNPPGQGSRKLYYYENSGLFRCYTECDSYFDIFELVCKVAEIQWRKPFGLNDAVRWIAQYFHINGTYVEDEETQLEDWHLLSQYERINDIKLDKNKQAEVILKTYQPDVLKHLNYKIKITPWLNEGISQEALNNANIGYYPGEDQITIPHFDKNGRFIGLRGRTVVAADAELYGKYRPVKIHGLIYRHPLGMNLYNYNHSQNNIKTMQKAIIFEGEKSCLLYQSYFGIENDISVACCGSSVSHYQIQMLLNAGVEEIIIAFDRQFQEKGDNEFNRLTQKLTKMNARYHQDVTLSFIFDKNLITGYKDSPIDCGKETFLKLFKERIYL